MKKAIKISIGILISILFLWLAFRKADIGKIVEILKDTKFVYLFISLAIGLVSMALRSLRWKLLGEEYRKIKWNNFFEATSMGLMLNIFLPFRAGDFFQAYFIAKKSGLSKSYTFPTVVMERFIDTIPPIFMLIIGSFFITLPKQISISRLLMLLVVILICLLSFFIFNEFIIRTLKKIGFISRNEKILKLIDDVSRTIMFLKHKQVLFKALPITFVLWLVMYSSGTFFLLKSLNINLSFFQVYIIQTIGVLGIAIPSSPGAVGTWEFFSLLALSIFNVEQNLALSYAVLSHFMAYLPLLILGPYFFIKEMIFGHLKLKEIEQESDSK